MCNQTEQSQTRRICLETQHRRTPQGAPCRIPRRTKWSPFRWVLPPAVACPVPRLIATWPMQIRQPGVRHLLTRRSRRGRNTRAEIRPSFPTPAGTYLRFREWSTMDLSPAEHHDNQDGSATHRFITEHWVSKVRQVHDLSFIMNAIQSSTFNKCLFLTTPC